MKVGDTVKTYGGWEALVIWEHSNDREQGYYIIHLPNTKDESVPIYHRQNGKAVCSFSVSAPPTFDKHHPADIVMD
jgi:hypothetical protein